jgi:hypothetical protein
MSPLTTKAQSLKFESKTPWSTARRPKKPRKAQEGHIEEENPQKSANDTKSSKSKQNDKERANKSSEEQEKLKINIKAQN